MPVTMKCTSGEWEGSFGVAVKALLCDMLRDQVPVPVRVNGEAVRMLSAVDHDDDLVFADSETLSIVVVDEIEVP